MPAPTLDQYPGYFPPAKRPFWTRLKVGVVAGLVGLTMGAAATGGAEAKPDSKASGDNASQAQISAAVDEATSELENELANQEDEAAAALEAQLKDAKATKAAAVAKTRKLARSDQKAAVKQAVKKALATERARQPEPAAAPEPAAPPVQSFAKTGGTDPQFSFCYEANDAGYGPYQSGVDPEYDWYSDNDGDGIVCES